MELLRWITTVGEKLGETQNQTYLNGHFGWSTVAELQKYIRLVEKYKDTFELAVRVRNIDMTQELDFSDITYGEICYMIEFLESMDWENDVEETTTIIVHGFTTRHYQLLYRLVNTLDQYHDLINTFITSHSMSRDEELDEFAGLMEGYRILDFMNKNYEGDMLPETYERMIRENFNQDDYVNLANTLVTITENTVLIEEVLKEAFE